MAVLIQNLIDVLGEFSVFFGVSRMIVVELNEKVCKVSLMFVAYIFD